MAQLDPPAPRVRGARPGRDGAVAADELLGELREQLARIVPSGMTCRGVSPVRAAASIEADPGQLRSSCMNLVANAADRGRAAIIVETRMASRDGVPCWQQQGTERSRRANRPYCCRYHRRVKRRPNGRRLAGTPRESVPADQVVGQLCVVPLVDDLGLEAGRAGQNDQTQSEAEDRCDE